MLQYSIKLLIYLSGILSTIPLLSIGMRRLAIVDKAARILVLSYFICFVGESIALYFAFAYRNNLWVYNILDLCISLLTWYYFQQHIRLLQRPSIQYACIASYIVVWVITTYYNNFKHNMNIGYVSFIGIVTILMALITLDQLIADKAQKIHSIIYLPHFWFALILLAYWSFSLIQWILWVYLSPQTLDHQIITASLMWSNLALNIFNTIVLYAYPKMMKKHAH